MPQLEMTIGALCLEAALFALLFMRSRRPVKFGEVRLFPYTPALIFLVVLFLVTGAHLVSLLTGTPLQARRPKGM